MNHAVQAGLLQSILENPGDDTARLVYADWLEEFAPAGAEGEPVRARSEFIRLTTRMRTGNGPFRSHTLLRQYEESWLPRCLTGTNVGRLTNYGTCQWARGFVQKLSLPCEAFLLHAGEIFAEHPVTEVVLTDRHPVPEPVGYSPVWAGYMPESSRLNGCLWDPLVRLWGREGRPDSWPAQQKLSKVCVGWGRQQACLRRRQEAANARLMERTWRPARTVTPPGPLEEEGPANGQ